MTDTTGPNKAIAGGVAGAVTVILMWIAHQFGGVDVPPEVASAFTTLIGTVAVWITPHGGEA